MRFAITRNLLVSLLCLTLINSSMTHTQTTPSIPETALPAPFALKTGPVLDPLQDFVHSVTNGQSNVVVGIYVPGQLALPVGQQPKGNAGFVTREPNTTTQFNLASKYGTVGILAHNDLAGAEFSKIQQNMYAIVVYGDGRLEYYIISDIQEYQALTPTSTFSDFVNLDDSGETLNASQLFTRIYGAGNRLVLQTCIAANGNASWGRLFIIARPATAQVLSVIQQTAFVYEYASLGLASH